MNDIFGVALISMHNDMERMDRIALNLANVATPGYRREVVAVQPFTDLVDAAAASGETSSVGEAQGSMQVLTDTRPGSVKATGQPLDLALSGDAFFEVSTSNGPAYTRQGNFRLDGSGRLVTAQGNPVMGTRGEIYLATRTPVIDVAGNITEPDAPVGTAASVPGVPLAQLRIVRFDGAKTLARMGDGLVAAGSGMTVLSEGQAQVRQGSLENSNVSSMHEMMQLIETMRHFESTQRIAQGYDEMLGGAIRKLGDL